MGMAGWGRVAELLPAIPRCINRNSLPCSVLPAGLLGSSLHRTEWLISQFSRPFLTSSTPPAFGCPPAPSSHGPLRLLPSPSRSPRHSSQPFRRRQPSLGRDPTSQKCLLARTWSHTESPGDIRSRNTGLWVCLQSASRLHGQNKPPPLRAPLP
jgi:hypothetical protein